MIVLRILTSEGPEVREEGGPLVLEKTGGDMSSEAAKLCLGQKGEADS